MSPLKTNISFMDSCIFCRIIKGELPSFKVWEDENYLAFLDIRPFKQGHTLVIPKKHTDYIFDLPKEELSGLMEAAKKVADPLKKTFNPKTGKIAVVAAGDQVFHVHLHLIPFDAAGDINFKNAHEVSTEELQTTLDKIKTALKS